jgi:hypothetical protein
VKWEHSSTILDVSGHIQAPAALSPVPIRAEIGWAAEPIWMLWNKENSFAPAVNRTLIPCSEFPLNSQFMKLDFY